MTRKGHSRPFIEDRADRDLYWTLLMVCPASWELHPKYSCCSPSQVQVWRRAGGDLLISICCIWKTGWNGKRLEFLPCVTAASQFLFVTRITWIPNRLQVPSSDILVSSVLLMLYLPLPWSYILPLPLLYFLSEYHNHLCPFSQMVSHGAISPD